LPRRFKIQTGERQPKQQNNILTCWKMTTENGPPIVTSTYCLEKYSSVDRRTIGGICWLEDYWSDKGMLAMTLP